MRHVDAESQRLVIVGGGFANLNLARHLKRSPIQVALLNETNYFNFQPLLYQVATGAWSPLPSPTPCPGCFVQPPMWRCVWPGWNGTS